MHAKESVVLLHGLARSSHSMVKLETALEKEGYDVVNIGYPSRQFEVEKLSEIVSEKIVSETADAEKIHFVTHSMGGIIVRYIQQHFPLDNIGRVVMLSPPNRGSEVVDKLAAYWIFKLINGPAGLQLGTSSEDLISELGPADFELGVITGDRSINCILSLMIPGKNDGKVSIERAQLNGMNDFKVVHATHPFIMKKKKVIDDVISFLNSGKFERE